MTVTAERLAELTDVAHAKVSDPTSGIPGSRLADILAAHDIVYREQPPDARGLVWYHVERCPFHDDGRPFECGVGQRLPNGPFAGKYFHPEGTDKKWAEWKAALGIDTAAVQPPPPRTTAEAASKRAPTKASQLLDLVDATGPTLFHTPDGDPYARIVVDYHHETLDLTSRRAERWPRQLSYAAMGGRVPSAQTVIDALNTLHARALFGGAEAPVFVRVGAHAGRVYIGLGTAD